MKLVAFDTSAENCSVAVQIDGEVRSDHRIVQREHAALLLPMVQGLLSEFSVSPAELDGVGFGRGPGSFTGVRIAAAAAQGLAIAADCGVQGVSSLQAMASACVREADHNLADTLTGSEWVLAALDARMDQIYVACYQAQTGVPQRVEEVVVGANEFLLNPERLVNRVVLCGSGAERYESVLAARCKEFGDLELNLISGVYPHALDLLSLIESNDSAQWLPPQEAMPVYLRNKVALTEAERSRA